MTTGQKGQHITDALRQIEPQGSLNRSLRFAYGRWLHHYTHANACNWTAPRRSAAWLAMMGWGGPERAILAPSPSGHRSSDSNRPSGQCDGR
jgi:hypothetical protein